ncbi:MAG: hypothetical protein J7K40_01260 [candidate division Zixibacteria bacterium]|nr:hypothetical protein [candidate division Zixibacteria bacterium]
MMEDNNKNLKQNEVIKMKDKGDFQVPVEDHFKALRLDNKQRNAALSILTDADAIVDENGEKQFSVRIYTDYILFRLDELSNSAKKLKSLDDLKNYESLTRGFLHEWTIIIGNISHLIAEGHNLDEIDEAGKTFERLIGDVRDIFEHLVDANKLYIEFGRALKDSPTSSQT